MRGSSGCTTCTAHPACAAGRPTHRRPDLACVRARSCAACQPLRHAGRRRHAGRSHMEVASQGDHVIPFCDRSCLHAPQACCSGRPGSQASWAGPCHTWRAGAGARLRQPRVPLLERPAGQLRQAEQHEGRRRAGRIAAQDAVLDVVRWRARPGLCHRPIHPPRAGGRPAKAGPGVQALQGCVGCCEGRAAGGHLSSPGRRCGTSRSQTWPGAPRHERRPAASLRECGPQARGRPPLARTGSGARTTATA